MGKSIRDYKGMYRTLTVEKYVEERWSLGPQAVFSEESISDDSKPGHVDRRLVQVLSVHMTPHIGHDGSVNGFDFEWWFFDFEAKQRDGRFCWGAPPTLYVFDEKEIDILD